MDNTKEKNESKPSRRQFYMFLGIALIAVALVCAILAVSSSGWRLSRVTPTPELTPTPAPPTPSPTPYVAGIRLYAFGRELNEDGFTAYVGDKPFTLSVELVTDAVRPEIEWLASDAESVELSVSADGLSCEFTALKPSGKNELTVRCYGCELVVPVYLWER